MPNRVLPAAPTRALALAGALAMVTVLAGCSNASAPAPPASGRASVLGASGFAGAALPPGIGAPPFTLTDQHARAVSLAGYRGQVTLVTFLYSTCGAPCVLVAQQIRGALDELPQQIPTLLISADPSADTPPSIKRFLARVSLSGRVEYLTGSRSQMAALLRSYRLEPPSAGRSAFDRALTVLLIDRRGSERVAFGLEQLTPEAIAHDIRKLDGDPTHP